MSSLFRQINVFQADLLRSHARSALKDTDLQRLKDAWANRKKLRARTNIENPSIHLFLGQEVLCKVPEGWSCSSVHPIIMWIRVPNRAYILLMTVSDQARRSLPTDPQKLTRSTPCTNVSTFPSHDPS